jgi:hypothetical protein
MDTSPIATLVDAAMIQPCLAMPLLQGDFRILSALSANAKSVSEVAAHVDVFPPLNET